MEQQRSQIESDQNGFFDKLRNELADAVGTISRLQGERLKLLSAIGEGAVTERELSKENKALRDKLRAETDGHKAILGVLDNVERMLVHLEEKYAGTWVYTGAERVYKSFCDALRTMSIEQVACAPGDAFDPQVHEAVALEAGAKGKVVRVLRRGYRYLDGGVIHHVLVTVGEDD